MTIDELASDASALDYAREFVRAAFAGIVPEDRFEAYAKPVADLLDMYAKSRLPLIAAELAGVARDPKLIDQVSRGLAAGWRGNPNMSGDDRDFMHPSMRRRHDEKSADACEFIALAIEAHARKMGEAE